MHQRSQLAQKAYQLLRQTDRQACVMGEVWSDASVDPERVAKRAQVQYSGGDIGMQFGGTLHFEGGAECYHSWCGNLHLQRPWNLSSFWWVWGSMLQGMTGERASGNTVSDGLEAGRSCDHILRI